MAIETIAAFAAKKVVVDAAPVVATAIATTVTKEIIDHSDEIADIATQVVCAPFELASSILDTFF
jgi:hypothetical protein